jgi:hypothetical protein
MGWATLTCCHRCASFALASTRETTLSAEINLVCTVSSSTAYIVLTDLLEPKAPHRYLEDPLQYI